MEQQNLIVEKGEGTEEQWSERTQDARSRKDEAIEKSDEIREDELRVIENALILTRIKTVDVIECKEITENVNVDIQSSNEIRASMEYVREMTSHLQKEKTILQEDEAMIELATRDEEMLKPMSKEFDDLEENKGRESCEQLSTQESKIDMGNEKMTEGQTILRARGIEKWADVDTSDDEEEEERPKPVELKKPMSSSTSQHPQSRYDNSINRYDSRGGLRSQTSYGRRDEKKGEMSMIDKSFSVFWVRYIT